MGTNNISRRGFLGASAAVMAGVAGPVCDRLLCGVEPRGRPTSTGLPVDPAKGGDVDCLRRAGITAAAAA